MKNKIVLKNNHKYKLLMTSISIFPAVVAGLCSFSSPTLADPSVLDHLQPVVEIGRKGMHHVYNALNHKLNNQIEIVAQDAGKKAATRIIKDLYKIRGMHGETASGEHVTLYSDNSTIVRGLIKRFTGIDPDSAFAPSIPGGQAMTKFMLDKLESYFLTYFVGSHIEQAIAHTTSALVHSALNTLKAKGVQYFEQQGSVVENPQISPLSSATLSQEGSTPIEVDYSKPISKDDVLEYYIALIRMGIQDTIHSVAKEQITYGLKTLEEQGITLGYSVGTTVTVAAATFVSPVLGAVVGSAAYLDSQLDLGGRDLFRGVVDIGSKVGDLAQNLSNFVATQKLLLPSALVVTEKDKANLYGKVDISHTEITEDGETWDKLDIKQNRTATLTNYVTQTAVKTVSHVKNKVTSCFSSVWGWAKSAADNITSTLQEPFDVFEEE